MDVTGGDDDLPATMRAAVFERAGVVPIAERPVPRGRSMTEAIAVDGAFADYILVDARTLIALPPGLPMRCELQYWELVPDGARA